MNASNVNTDDPPPYFLITDLHQITFTSGSEVYQSDDTSPKGLLAWSAIVDQNATIKGDVDWESLEERAHFLNKLYAFCRQKSLTFPFDVDPEIFNVIRPI